jgi:hypothetical protein
MWLTGFERPALKICGCGFYQERLQYGYHASVFPCGWEALPTEDLVKHKSEKGYHALWNMSQDLVHKTDWARSLASLESFDGIKDFRRAG